MPKVVLELVLKGLVFKVESLMTVIKPCLDGALLRHVSVTLKEPLLIS